MAAGQLPSSPPNSISNQRDQAAFPSLNAEINNGLVDFPPLMSSCQNVKSFGVPAENPKWRSLFELEKGNTMDSSIYKLNRHDTQLIEGKKTSIISSTDIVDELKVCDKLVVGYFVGRKLPFSAVKEALEKLWKLKGVFRMTIHEESMFIFDFDLEEDRVAVLGMGSVTISSKLFLIRPWKLFIEHNIQDMKSIPVWMNLRKVPIHLWNAKGLSMIASVVGIPLFSDKHTLERTRMSYARVCVEMEATSDFPDSIPVVFDGKEFMVAVEYPWKPPRCLDCATFGHSRNKCSKGKKMWIPKVSKGVVDGLEKLAESVVVPEDGSSRVGDEKAGNNEQIRGEAAIQAPAEPPKEAAWTVYSSRKNRQKQNKQSGATTSHLSPSLYHVPDSRVGDECNEDQVNIEVPRASECTVAKSVSSAEEWETDESSDEDSIAETRVEVEKGSMGSVEACNESREDDLEVSKVKAVQEVSKYKPMTKEQNLARLAKFSSKLQLDRGGKEEEVKNICRDIVFKQTNVTGPNNEELGRGKRTPLPKKKY